MIKEFYEKYGDECLRTWDAIAPDAEHETGEEAWELIIDAGRLEMYGSAEAQEAARALIHEYGYIKTLEELAKLCPL